MHVKIRLLLVSVLVTFVCCVAASVRPKYRHFEDYLNNLDSNEQSWISTGQDADSNSTSSRDQDHEDPTTSTTTSTTTTESPHIQEEPTSGNGQDVSCCLLGQLAGDKGYHCYSQYYAARILLRNRNRAHNRKMAFYGPQRIKNYGEKVMRTFEQCVASRGTIFHKCCHLSSMERRTDRYDTAQRAQYERKQRADEGETDEDSA